MGRAAEDTAALQWQCHTHLFPLQVPKIVSCILENLPYITPESGCKKVESLFLLMTSEYGSAVVISLCETALQGDRYWP